ncbi:hypothetical protein [Sphingomonas sp. Ant20]|uniref:hypothetical protein n=1 Tax=Sphingomonas sp. Ant20 TaxID=104605 RepID=UPI000538D6A3|nr:hypothetical protein [Sphingomonas sp. Ant20]KHA64774.1 hypothetical protein NI18_06420 [Sphingomonas sp. Ant20]
MQSSYDLLLFEKAELDDRLVRQDWSDVRFCRIEFDGLLPVTTACAFYPKLDFAGRRLQGVGNIGVRPADLSFTITSFGGRTSVIFAWRGPETGAPRRFIDSFLAIDDDEKAARIAAFCFEISENVQMTPTWWAGLDQPVRRRLSDKMWDGTARQQHVASAMADVAPLPVAVTVASVSRSWAATP